MPEWPANPSLAGTSLHLYDLPELLHGPLFQLPDLTHGFIKAGHLGRQLLFFLELQAKGEIVCKGVAQVPSQRRISSYPLPYIDCQRGPIRAGFHLFRFHLNWLLSTEPAVGAQLLDSEEIR